MAQATRTSSTSVGLSDDPIENASAWLQVNQKPIMVGIGILAISAAAIFGYRWMDADKRSKANSELYKATAPLSEGRLPEAQVALARVVKQFGGTSSGNQAALLLAQVMYEQKKFAEGIASLEQAKGSAGSEFASPLEAMIGVGYESQGKFNEAAEHYAKAASSAKFPLDRATNQAQQARNLTLAGKPAEARKLWEELAKSEDLPFAQEAQVRLGELVGAGK